MKQTVKLRLSSEWYFFQKLIPQKLNLDLFLFILSFF